MEQSNLTGNVSSTFDAVMLAQKLLYQNEGNKFLRFIYNTVNVIQSNASVEVIRNGEEVIEMYLEAWQAEGESIPKPNTLQIA